MDICKIRSLSLLLLFWCLLITPHNSAMAEKYADGRAMEDEITLEYVDRTLIYHCSDVAIYNDYAYCSFGYALLIYNISDPTQPHILNTIKAVSPKYGLIKISDGHLHIISSNGYEIYDINNPIYPELISEVAINDIRGFDVDGNVACISHGVYLDLVDISDVANPQIRGSISFDIATGNITIVNDTVYMAESDLRLIDISNPDSLRLINRFETSGYAADLVVDNNYIYVADAPLIQPFINAHMTIIDKTDPDSLFILCSFNLKGHCSDIKKMGDYVFMNAGLSGFLILDVSNPIDPGLAGCFLTPGWAGPFDIKDTLVILANYIAPSPEAEPYNNCDSSWTYLPDSSLNQGDLIFLNIQDIPNPQILDLDSFPGIICEVISQDSIIYVGHGERDGSYYGGISILEISHSESILFKSFVNLHDPAVEMALYGDYLYVANLQSGLQIINVENSEFPYIVDSISFPDVVLDVTVYNNILFVSAGSYGLVIYDISIPWNPEYLSHYDTPDFAIQTILWGDYAFIADRYSGLQILNISNPNSPQFVTVFSYLGSNTLYNSMCLQNEHIYLADGYGYFEIVNITDPANPMLAGQYFNSAETKDIEVVGDFILLANGDQGLQVVNVSDAANPYWVTSFENSALSTKIDIKDSRILIADYYSLLWLNYSILTDINIENGNLYKYSDYHLYPNYPNPFNHSTLIKYDIPRRSHVTITIYNILGQKITTLLDQEIPQGNYSVAWDGRNSHGITVSSGIYYCRLSFGNVQSAVKVIYLK